VTSPTLPQAPTAPRERLGAVDLLRGFALCGILVINMRYFAMPMAKRLLNDPNHPGDVFGAADFWSWFGSSLLFEDKMMALFSVLFGAGIWLMRDRGLFLHYRRMFWLTLIGVGHAVLLWFGDILTLYALCGMVVVWFRRLPPSLLIVLGLSSAFFATGERSFEGMLAESEPVAAVEPPAEAPAEEAEPATGAETGGGAEAAGSAGEGDAVLLVPVEEEGAAEPPQDPPATEVLAEPAAETGDAEAAGATPAEEDRSEDRAEAAAEEGAVGLLSYRREFGRDFSMALRESFDPETEKEMHEGSWWHQVGWRADLVLWWQGGNFLLNGLLWNGGLMLVGMGLMGLGFLTGKLRAGVYLGLGFAAMAFGLAFSALGLWPQALEPLGRMTALWNRDEGPPPASFRRYVMLADVVRRFGTLLVCFGWASLLLWLQRSGVLRALLYPLRAVGRMALTNYLTHTVVCVILFEGWALGRWNEVRYFEQMQLVGAILLAQLIVCPIWLALFRFGPMEWLWRSLTYWKLQPLRRRAPKAAPPPDAPLPSPPPPHGFAGDSPVEQTAG